MNKNAILLLISICFTGICEAQNLLTNNNSLVVINPNVPFTVEGGILNNGLISNEGVLRLSGNWANSGDYRSVSGTFTLSGDNVIFDPGSSVYSHLSINTSGMAIIDDLIVSESLELLSGVVSISPASKVQLMTNASILGGNESAYIDGALFTASSGAFTFPIGTETEYLPVTLTEIQLGDSVGVRAFSTAIDAEISPELDNYSPNRYWRILSNESFSAKEITLPMKEENFLESVDEAVIAFTSELDSHLQVIGVTEANGSTISGSATSSANIFPGFYLIADKSINTPPVTVINVVTTLQDGKHDFLRIDNIEFYENNLVEIFDRQGVKVFEMSGYDNQDKVFRGVPNKGSRSELATGTYYYTIKLTGSKREAGFIYLKN